MYTQSHHGVGASPNAVTPAQQGTSFLDSLIDIAKTGYGMFTQSEIAKKQAEIEKAKVAAEVAIAQAKAGIVPSSAGKSPITYQQSSIQSGGMDWTIPLLVGTVGLGAVVFFMSGKRR